MDDAQILQQIHQLVTQEHAIRDALNGASLDSSHDRSNIRSVEESLDQCWDLLRQRRALQVSGQSLDQARPRPKAVVESYLQ